MSDEEEVKKIREQKEELLKKMIDGPAMPQEILHIDTLGQFNEMVEKYKDKIIVIDFWAEWCGPCKMFGPVFERVQKEWRDRFVFVKINTEVNAEVAGGLGIMSIPNIMFIKDKKKIHEQPGAMQKAQFVDLLSRVKNAVDKMDSGTHMHS